MRRYRGVRDYQHRRGAAMSALAKLAQLRNRYARAQGDRKSTAEIHKAMVAITTKQLRREIRQDRRKAK